MSEILVKTLTRHRSSLDKYYLKDWTAFDVVQIEKDGYFTKNPYKGAKLMGVVLKVAGNIPKDFHLWKPTASKAHSPLTDGRTKYIIDLSKLLTDKQLKAAFDHSLYVDPITVKKSYLDLFIDRSLRTKLHTYDKSGSFDNETVDVGPNGHSDANTFLEFESNVAISAGEVIGLADEDFDETSAITIGGTGAVSGKPITFRTTGDGKHDGKEDTTAARLVATSNYGYIFVINDDYVNVDGLQIVNLTTASGGCINCNHSGETKINDCILKSGATGTRSGIALTPGANATTKIWNNIIYGGYRGISHSYGNAGQTYIIYNNTLADLTNVGIYISDGVGDVSLYLKNNLVFNTSDDYNVSAFTTQDYDGNMGEDAAFSGDSNYVQTSQAGTAIFKDYNNQDYHIKTGSDAENAGVDLRSDAQLNITDDIDGDSRSDASPCIGADELTAAGTTTSSTSSTTSSTSSTVLTTSSTHSTTSSTHTTTSSTASTLSTTTSSSSTSSTASTLSTTSSTAPGETTTSSTSSSSSTSSTVSTLSTTSSTHSTISTTSSTHSTTSSTYSTTSSTSSTCSTISTTSSSYSTTSSTHSTTSSTYSTTSSTFSTISTTSSTHSTTTSSTHSTTSSTFSTISTTSTTAPGVTTHSTTTSSSSTSSTISTTSSTYSTTSSTSSTYSTTSSTHTTTSSTHTTTSSTASTTSSSYSTTSSTSLTISTTSSTISTTSSTHSTTSSTHTTTSSTSSTYSTTSSSMSTTSSTETTTSSSSSTGSTTSSISTTSSSISTTSSSTTHTTGSTTSSTASSSSSSTTTQTGATGTTTTSSSSSSSTTSSTYIPTDAIYNFKHPVVKTNFKHVNIKVNFKEVL